MADLKPLGKWAGILLDMREKYISPMKKGGI